METIAVASFCLLGNIKEDYQSWESKVHGHQFHRLCHDFLVCLKSAEDILLQFLNSHESLNFRDTVRLMLSAVSLLKV